MPTLILCQKITCCAEALCAVIWGSADDPGLYIYLQDE